MSALYLATVTEAPRTGQRKARVYYFVVSGNDQADAERGWAESRYSKLYGNLPSDTTVIEPAGERVWRTR